MIPILQWTGVGPLAYVDLVIIAAILAAGVITKMRRKAND